MPPKRNKGITPSVTPTGTAAANKSWETALTDAVFEENDWRASLSMVQAERAEDEQLINALQQAVQKPLRKLFSVLSWGDTLEKINELGNPKTRKTKDGPMFFEVTELAKSLMDGGEEITVDLMAKLIKFQLLTIKNNDFARRAAERKAVEENAHVKAGLNSASKDQGGKGAAKGKKAAEPPVPTKDTKLKRRGEEENTLKYIDDEPDDGPEHYILIVGFYQPHLISALDSLGIHVSNVIKLNLEREDQSEATTETAAEENHHSPEDQEVETLKQRRQQELDVFWEMLDRVLNSGNMGSRLRDVARLNYSVKIHLLPQDKDNVEEMLAFGAAIFESVACLVYDNLDWRRQYNHYLSCMRLIQVPLSCRSIPQSRPQSSTEVVQTPRKKVVTEEDPAEPESPVQSTEVNMRYYCDLLDRIPTEITSVSLILHCMLEQVVASEQEVNAGSVDSEEHVDRTDKDLIRYMLSSFLSLPLDEEDKKELMEDFGMQKSPMNADPKHPLLLNHHDESARRLLQLPILDGFDVAKIEADIMKKSLVWTDLMVRHTESTTVRLARSQELMHFCTDESLSWFELQRLLQLFVFESMRLTTVDEKGCIKRSQCNLSNPTPWDNPVEFTKRLYWSNSRTPGSAKNNGTDEPTDNEVTVTDLQKTLIRQLGHWNFVEKHSASVFPQVIQSASETYRCVDTFHCARDNATYVICHNPMSPQRSCKEFWDASLHTDVGFRNYLEYVADSIREWTRQEEEKWQMEQEKKEAERTPIQTPSEADRNTDSSVKSPISDTLEQYIREDSLKAWKMDQERLREEEQSKKTKKEKGGRATPKVEETIASVKENKKTSASSRKSRENMSKTPSSTTKDKTRDIPETPQEPANERKTDVFTGYSLNGKLVQVTGKVQSLYPCDGGQIDVESFHFTQGMTQVKVCVKKDGHQFYTNISQRKKEDKLKDFDMFTKQATLGVKPDREMEKYGSFHAVLANGIRLSCCQSSPNKTKSYALQRTVPGVFCTDQQEQVPEVHCEPTDDSSPPPFLNLHVSLPNGLILHFDFEDSANGESCVRSLLIRQRFYNAGSSSDLTPDFSTHTEVSRVITDTGTVIKHKRDGSTEVLFADGTVSTSPDSGPVCVMVQHMSIKEAEPIKELTVDIKETKDKKGKASKVKNIEDEQHISIENEKPKNSVEITGGSWTTTTPSGLRVATVAGKEVQVQPILAYHVTDPFSGTVVVTREDKMLSVLKKDGTVIVDHADGTRITTFYQQGELQQQLLPGENLVRVENPDFATVTMNSGKRTCDVFFGDGTSISATAHGSYKISPRDGGVLHIDEDGGAVYTSHQSKEGPDKDPPGQFVMNHGADVLCHVTDPEGNYFQVNSDSQITVMTNGSEMRETETELQQNDGFKTHPPRLFVVHEDGSASELLRAQDMEDLLQKAYCDSSIAVLTDPLPDSQQSFVITLLRPCPEISTHWLSSNLDNDIIPTNLKSRKWESFPASEKKTPGPSFGTTLGCSLELKEKPLKPCSIRIQPVFECPDLLLVRQITQHLPVTETLRRKLQDKVKAYLEQLLQRENEWEKMQLKDLQTAEEKVHQNDLLQLVLSQSDAVDPPVEMEIKPLSADVASLYTQAVRAAQHPHKLQEKTEQKVLFVSKKKQKSVWEKRVNQNRQELQELKRHRNALRHHIVTPYFHPELKENALFKDEARTTI
ncbi:sperm-associated antigen 17 [Pimephales promelas]|uniref:sperm-associated antigen 17 n=1 Tax=Pimephales promelas TaxID=90988 RepID=UPI0019558A51|nr:sperm-associated antigen 17 [Pimephales promelas]